MNVDYHTIDLRFRYDGPFIIEAFGPNGEYAESQTKIPDQDFLNNIKKLLEGNDSSESIHTIGDKLGEILMPHPIFEVYTIALNKILELPNRGLRIKLHFSDSARLYSWIPWELSKIKGIFIGFDPIQSVIRTIDLIDPAPSLTVEKPPYRILLVSQEPEALGNVGFENKADSVKNAIAPLSDNDLVELEILKNPSLSDIETILRDKDYHIFHFIGHSMINSDGNGILFFTDQFGNRLDIDGYRFARLLQRTAVKMVLLSGMESAYGRNAGIGVAEALIKTGIPIVVAYNEGAISNVADKSFIKSFYIDLLKINSLDSAMRAGRKSISEMYEESGIWALPIIFSRTIDGKFWHGDAGFKIATFIQGDSLVTELKKQSDFDVSAFANRLETALKYLEKIQSDDERLKAQQLIAEVQDNVTDNKPDEALKKLSQAFTHIHLTINLESAKFSPLRA